MKPTLILKLHLLFTLMILGASCATAESDGPEPLPTVCDDAAYFKAFFDAKPKPVDTIHCLRELRYCKDPMGGPDILCSWIRQDYERYARPDGTDVVTLWDSINVVRVEGASAPECIKRRFNAPVPVPPLTMADCVITKQPE